MKAPGVFGLLFFFLSVIFCALQLITLSATEVLQPGPLLLQFSTCVFCLVLGSLASQIDHRTILGAISVVAFSVSFLALLAAGLLALRGATEMAPLRFLLFLAYTGFYALFGLAFSFLEAKSANANREQSA